MHQVLCSAHIRRRFCADRRRTADSPSASDCRRERMRDVTAIKIEIEPITN